MKWLKTQRLLKKNKIFKVSWIFHPDIYTLFSPSGLYWLADMRRGGRWGKLKK